MANEDFTPETPADAATVQAACENQPGVAFCDDVTYEG